jgi:hypothetical protein
MMKSRDDGINEINEKEKKLKKRLKRPFQRRKIIICKTRFSVREELSPSFTVIYHSLRFSWILPVLLIDS